MTSHESRIARALEGARNPKEAVADELRKMIAGEGEYKCFTYTSPRIKNVWAAAADLLDEVPAQLN